MAKVEIFKEQRVGGGRRQYMLSIGTMRDSNDDTSGGSDDKAENEANITISYEDWLASRDEEIGYWESLFPYYF